MKSKKGKIAALAAALVMSLNLSLGVNAQVFQQNEPPSPSAILDYNRSTGTYELLDKNGVSITEEFMTEKKDNIGDKTEIKPSPITTAPQSPSLYFARKTTTTVLTTAAVTTTSTTKLTTTTTYNPKRYIASLRPTKPATTTTTAKKTTTTTTKKTTKATTTTPKTTEVLKPGTKGIDVSRWQGNIDWNKVKAAGIKFVMIRAGYGKVADQVDMNFKTNIEGAQKAGIDCGIYWYSYATNTADALLEAKTCYNTIKGYKLSYPVAFDIEDPSQMSLTTTQISNITKVFCDYFEEKKYYTVVYSFASLLNTKFNSSVFSKYDIWVAHVKVNKPAFSKSYGIWQYSHTGRVNGISGDVDLDYSYKNYPSIIKNNKFNGY